MDCTLLCRTCLGNTKLNPLFSTQDYSRDICLISGVKVKYDDGLPQNICSHCVDFLDNVIKFRNQCRAAEEYLLKIQSRLRTYKNCTEKNIPLVKEEIKEFVYVQDEDIRIGNEMETSEKSLKPFNRGHNCSKTEVVVKIENTVLDIEDTSNIAVNSYEETENAESINQNNIKEVQKNTNSHKKGEMEQKRVICQICQKNLSVRSIDKHMDTCHPGANDKKVKCELCDTYVFKYSLTRHNSRMHSTGRCICVRCRFEFDSKQGLLDHIATCAYRKQKRRVCEADRKLTKCDVCQQVMQKGSLRMHKAVKHAGLGPVCEHCGRSFGNKLRLNEHCRAKHGYEKLKCSHCSYQTSGVVSLRNHEQRHRGDKPFVCEQCGASFHASYLLAQHRYSHRTEKLFKCEQCPARFKARNALHAHRGACHSAARYACAHCARTYSCRQYAARHLRTFHRGARNADTTPLLLPLVVEAD